MRRLMLSEKEEMKKEKKKVRKYINFTIIIDDNHQSYEQL